MAANGVSGPEMYLGLVAPIGTPTSWVRTVIEAAFGEFGYTTHFLRLSDYLDAALEAPPFPSNHEDERVNHYMDAGDRLCELSGREDAVLGPALVALRNHRREETGNQEVPASRTVYIFSSLKRPKEVERLQSIYGPWFFLIGAQAPLSFRRNRLLSEIQETRTDPDTARHKTEQLLLRDRQDLTRPFGQNVLQTFPLADLFVDLSVQLILRKYTASLTLCSSRLTTLWAFQETTSTPWG